MIRKIISIIAAACFFSPLSAMLTKQSPHTKFSQFSSKNSEISTKTKPEFTDKAIVLAQKPDQFKEENHITKKDMALFLRFTRNAAPEIQKSIFDNLGVESKEDYDKAIKIISHPHSKDATTAGLVFDLTPETREVLDMANNHFDTTGKSKIILTREQRNALVPVSFLIKNGFHNGRTHYKAIVKPTVFDRFFRVVTATTIGGLGGATIGILYAGGVEYGKNIETGYNSNLEQKLTIFNEKYAQTFKKEFDGTYKEVVLKNADPAEEIIKEFQFGPDTHRGTGYKGSIEDKIGEDIYTNARDLVLHNRAHKETMMQNNPEYAKEQRLITDTVNIECPGPSIINEETATFGIGSFGGFLKGVFENSFHKHHDAAVEIGIQTATNTAFAAAVAAVQNIGGPLINSASWKDIKDGFKTGGTIGSLVGAGHGLYTMNDPVSKEYIHEIDKPI